MIGIIGAMDEEVEQIVAVMDIKKEETKACMTFKAGILAGKDVVIVRSGIGKINAKINIMYQKLRPLNEYLDNAKPVVSDTAVWANANNAENQIELNNEPGISRVFIAFLKLLSVACFAIHVTEGSIKSLEVIIAFEIISNIGCKNTNPIQISKK